MKRKITVYCLAALGVLVLGTTAAFAHSNMGTVKMKLEDESGVVREREGILLSRETEVMPDGYIYSEELYEILP